MARIHYIEGRSGNITYLFKMERQAEGEGNALEEFMDTGCYYYDEGKVIAQALGFMYEKFGLTQFKDLYFDRYAPNLGLKDSTSTFVGYFTLEENPEYNCIEKIVKIRNKILIERCSKSDESLKEIARKKTIPTVDHYKSIMVGGDIYNKVKEKYEQEKKRVKYDENNFFGYVPKEDRKNFIEMERTINNLEMNNNNYTDSVEGYISYIKDYRDPNSYGFLSKPFEANISLRARKKHTYILAQTGSGKSELMKILAVGDILNSACSTIFIDPHGDITDQLASLDYKKFGKLGGVDIVYVNPTLQEGFSPSINPFDMLNNDYSENNISRVTGELLRVFDNLLSGAGTTDQMKAILYPCISVLVRKKGGCFEDLQRFMDDKNNEDLILLGKQSPNIQHARFFEEKFSSSSYDVTKHGIYTRIQNLLNDSIFSSLIGRETTINLRELIDSRSNVLFRLSMGEGGTTAMIAFGRFIVAMVRIIALQRSSQKENERVTTFLYIDEVQNFISDDLEQALSQLRKFGVHTILANQYVGQNMTTSMQRVLFSCGVKFIGLNEVQSSKIASAQMRIDHNEIQKLKVGEFYLKTENNESIKIKVPSDLMKEKYSSDEEIQIVKYCSRIYYSKVNNRNDYYSLTKDGKENKPHFIKKPKYDL